MFFAIAIVYVFLFSRVSRYVSTFQFKASLKRKALLEALQRDPNTTKVVGYFHPYCNLGGGGERVLWAAIQYMQNKQPDVLNVVYTGDVEASKEQIISKVKKLWDMTLEPSSLHFVYLSRRNWVEDSTWPVVTLMGQSLGSMYLVWEALSLIIPDLYIDSMGYAFTYHIVAWLTRSPPSFPVNLPFLPTYFQQATRPPIPIVTYTHYPTISHTMLNRVRTRSTSTTNSSIITQSSFLSSAKIMYLRFFSYYYSLSMRRAQIVMVNSSWTKGHIDKVLAAGDELAASSASATSDNEKDPLIPSLHARKMFLPLFLIRYILRNGEWNGDRPSTTKSLIVYPPCETKPLEDFSLSDREKVIISLAQFRPEKDLPLQIRAFHHLVQVHPEHADARLVQIGGIRPSDVHRVEELRELAEELGISDKVEFITNAPYATIIEWLERASIGVSTMVDEHFGVNIVEYMAAGLIPVTNKSGGPYLDIATPEPSTNKPTGFHCTTVAEYAEAFNAVFSMSSSEQTDMRLRVRKRAVEAFSRSEFDKGWEESGVLRWLEIA